MGDPVKRSWSHSARQRMHIMGNAKATMVPTMGQTCVSNFVLLVYSLCNTYVPLIRTSTLQIRCHYFTAL